MGLASHRATGAMAVRKVALECYVDNPGRVNSFMPSIPCSRPMPDCFAPPNGMSKGMSRCLLTHTGPESIAWQRRARARDCSSRSFRPGRTRCRIDHRVEIVIGKDRKDRSELFLAYQAAVVWQIADDGGCDEIALPVDRVATGDHTPRTLGVRDQL